MKQKPLTWHKGPPPHIGWWNASIGSNSTAWRWWDGKQWSITAYSEESEHWVNSCATQKSEMDGIEWTYHWPKNARVPRINPETGEVTGKP